jgi:hypothetical protein
MSIHSYTRTASSALAAVALMATSLASPVSAESVKDTYVGKIEFQDQTITKATAEMLHRRMALQRASQLVLWSLPITSIYQLVDALKSNLGVDGNEPEIGLYQGYSSVYPFLTANRTTPYTVSVVDLSKTGPLVVNIPAGGVYGVANDAWEKPIKEIDSGKAETLLFVGPGQKYPKDFKGEIIQSDTFIMLYFYRVLGTGPKADKLKTAVKAYKLSDAANPPPTKFITYDPKKGDKVGLNTQPRDMTYWELVNDYVQKEPMADRDRFFYAWLRDLGIKKGEPFKPTADQKKIMMEGLEVGMAMAQATSFNKTREMFPTALYGKDSGWENVMAGMNPKIDMKNYSMFNERASYTFEAVTTSAGMISRVPGKGSAYLGTYYDADGNALMGGNNYSLRIEPNEPAANFWSITVYDIENRLLIRNDIEKSGINSRQKSLIKNADGSVDFYFGPKAPEGKGPNWVQTNKGQSYFLYLRLYGPEQPFFDQKWPINKAIKMK